MVCHGRRVEVLGEVVSVIIVEAKVVGHAIAAILHGLVCDAASRTCSFIIGRRTLFLFDLHAIHVALHVAFIPRRIWRISVTRSYGELLQIG